MKINTNMSAASRPCSEWPMTLPEVGRNGMSTTTAPVFSAASASRPTYVQVLGTGTHSYAAAPQITRDHDVLAFPVTSAKLGYPPRGVPR